MSHFDFGGEYYNIISYKPGTINLLEPWGKLAAASRASAGCVLDGQIRSNLLDSSLPLGRESVGCRPNRLDNIHTSLTIHREKLSMSNGGETRCLKN